MAKKTKINTSNLYPYKKIVVIYSALCLVLIIAIVYLIFSKAQVLVSFEPEKIASNFVINIGAKTNFDEETIKGDVLEKIMVKEDVVLPTKTTSTVESKASGEVTIANNYNKSQTLIATTRLLSPEGLIFRIAKTVVVPAGGKIKVTVTADQLGKQYEIGPSKFTIPGLWPGLQDKIYGTSESPMSTTSQNVGSINPESIEKAKKDLENKLIDEVKNETKPQIIKYEITEESISPKLEEIKNLDEAEQIKINLKMKFTIIKFDEKEMENLIKDSFKKLITQEKELISINKDALSYNLEKINLGEKTAKIKISAEGNFVPDLKTMNFPKDKLVGLTDAEVRSYMSNFPTIKNVEINLRPFWLKTMPLLSDKIEIKIVK